MSQLVQTIMQDPNEDTQWNDVLRSKGILPPKEKEAAITEDTIVQVDSHHLLYSCLCQSVYV